jgi:hypothetical protein
MRRLLPQFRNIATRAAFWCCLLVGAIIVGRGVQLGLPSIHLAISGVRGQGEVIANAGGLPEIEFFADGKETHTFISRTGSSPPEFSVGETAPILYDAQAPDQYVIIRSFGDMWLWPGLLAGFGLMIIIGTFLVASAHREILFLLISLAPGVALLSAGLAGVGSLFQLSQHGVTVEGKVAKVDGRIPLIEFQGPNGAVVKFLGDSGGFLPNQPVTVIYDPDHPQQALIRSQMWSNSILTIGIGAAFVVVPLLFTYFFFHHAPRMLVASFWTVLVGVVGLAFLGYGLLSLGKTLDAESDGVQVAGSVIRNNYDGEVYYPVVKLHTTEGKDVQFIGAIGSSPADYQEGDAVTILYPPQHPDQAMIRSFEGLWLRPVSCGPIGLILVFASFFYLRSRLAEPEPLEADALAAHP